MIDYDFHPGEWVPVLNKSNPAKDEGREGRAGYMCPWIVVYRLRNGAYQLAELSGAVSVRCLPPSPILPTKPPSSTNDLDHRPLEPWRR